MIVSFEKLVDSITSQEAKIETQLMKNWIPLVAAFSILLASPASVEAGYPSQFLGVCQKTGKDIIAYYRPVKCTDGRVEYQWVTERPCYCRPAYKGKKKYDFFNSHLMNPANKKWKDRNRQCASLHQKR